LFTRNFKLSNYDSINGVDSRTVLKNKPNVDIDNYQKLEAVKSDKYPDFYSQLKAVKSDEFINKFSSELRSILIINPLPDRMRDYSKLSEKLESDASNIAGVLAALPDEKKLEIESTLSHYLEHFPEGDIKKIWAEKVGRLGTDAMLYCQEEWQPGQITEIDARSMSDGTLRLLGILTALLTRPEGSLIVIEEIDNGLHPSRAELLVKILREIGTKRKIDLLITTHNPALLDALGPEIIPFVTVVHRDAETGESKLTLLEDIENLPKLLATGSLGKLATKGTIEKTLAKSI
jgi:predicted ATPase